MKQEFRSPGYPAAGSRPPAKPPKGRFDVDLTPEDRALGAIGDSAVVEALGLGAMAINLSPEQHKNLGNFLPSDYLARMDGLSIGTHPYFRRMNVRLGLSARDVVELGRGPMIGLGILDKVGEAGRLGGGIYDMPVEPFAQAVAALEDSE